VAAKVVGAGDVQNHSPELLAMTALIRRGLQHNRPPQTLGGLDRILLAGNGLRGPECEPVARQQGADVVDRHLHAGTLIYP